MASSSLNLRKSDQAIEDILPSVKIEHIVQSLKTLLPSIPSQIQQKNPDITQLNKYLWHLVNIAELKPEYCDMVRQSLINNDINSIFKSTIFPITLYAKKLPKQTKETFFEGLATLLNSIFTIKEKMTKDTVVAITHFTLSIYKHLSQEGEMSTNISITLLDTIKKMVSAEYELKDYSLDKFVFDTIQQIMGQDELLKLVQYNEPCILYAIFRHFRCYLEDNNRQAALRITNDKNLQQQQSKMNIDDKDEKSGSPPIPPPTQTINKYSNNINYKGEEFFDTICKLGDQRKHEIQTNVRIHQREYGAIQSPQSDFSSAFKANINLMIKEIRNNDNDEKLDGKALDGIDVETPLPPMAIIVQFIDKIIRTAPVYIQTVHKYGLLNTMYECMLHKDLSVYCVRSLLEVFKTDQTDVQESLKNDDNMALHLKQFLKTYQMDKEKLQYGLKLIHVIIEVGGANKLQQNDFFIVIDKLELNGALHQLRTEILDFLRFI